MKFVVRKVIEQSDSNNVKKKSEEFHQFNFFKWFIKKLKHFCSVTSLHGYGHIIREDTSLWEKIFWSVTVLSSSLVAISLLWLSWNWNSETPVVTVIESTHFATWNIPFPSVTICNINKISAESAKKKATSMTRPDNVTVDDLSKMFSLIMHFQGVTSFNAQSSEQDEQYMILDSILKANGITVDKLFADISPKCSEMLQRCMWKGTQARCDTLFQPINSSFGICCSFNYYGLSTNNYPTKMAHSIPKQPRRVTACGYQTGLTVLMTPNVSDYHTTLVGSFGFRVAIHNAYDYPDANAENKLISSRLEAFLNIAPETTYSTDDVYDLPLNIRNCLSDTEVRLNVMQRYSYLNCLAECRSSIIYRLCGCVPFHLLNNGSLPICGMDKIRCVLSNLDWYIGALPGVNKTIIRLNENVKSSCNCLPDCQSYQYSTEISTALFTRNNSFNNKNFFKDISINDQSLIHIFFNDLVSTRYRQDIYQNWLGVLATFGGILGLFLGFSLVTGFELIYLFTLRILFDHIAPKKDN